MTVVVSVVISVVEPGCVTIGVWTTAVWVCGIGAGLVVTATVLLDVPGVAMLFTFVFVPTAVELPLPGAELLEYTLPELSTLAGPGCTTVPDGVVVAD